MGIVWFNDGEKKRKVKESNKKPERTTLNNSTPSYLCSKSFSSGGFPSSSRCQILENLFFLTASFIMQIDLIF